MLRRERQALTLLTLPVLAAACLTGCGGPARDGYAAAGAVAPGPERRAGDNVAPRAPVEFQQLAGSPSSTTSTSASAPGSQSPAASARSGATTAPPGTTPPGTAPPPQPPPGASPSVPAPGTPTPKPGTTPPATPARLTLSPPTRTPAADRWCENVTMGFTNTGTTPTRSGTVSFATHIIGALGIDWATITTTQPLPTPIPGGTTKTQTYTVCVESWRVPLGMHIETRATTATWT
ncbi:hypothetical protein [Streptomyces sp. NBC_01443]|uniref:hypothetical protein n=1 Tax=Streptomyces sp. NBC_01443 TaxID=2903868 RepID=UPI00224ED381|nr:hypothetical protein [Streptomyces sp. NBC_01443]MCX4628941.1 hypothetical protein [Streptomyces sp. NBC_01443]